MRVTIVTKLGVENTPPLETVAILMARLGLTVRIINYCSGPEGRKRLADHGVMINSFGKAKWPNQIFHKTKEAARFSIFINDLLAKESFDLLWLCNPDIVPLLKRQYLHGSVVLQTLELYDKVRRYQKYIKKIDAQGGQIVVPDKVRAYVLKASLGLKSVPMVIRNKPYHHPRLRRVEGSLTNMLPPEIRGGDKKMVLYQGHISRDRPILEVARAVADFSGLQFVAMGGSKDLKYLDDIVRVGGVHIDYVPAPWHLQITGWADIGVMSYDHISLNTLFCAPNKVFEYTGYGIPFISSYHPTLTEYCTGFSRVCESFTAGAIADALQKLLGNYEVYSSNASKFYDEADIEAEVASVVKKARVGQ